MVEEITEDNFLEYFIPASKDYTPESDKVLARWRCAAEFVDDWLKRNVIELLASKKNGYRSALSIMVNMVGAREEDALAVLIEMCNDLKTMAIDKVAEKPYKMIIQKHFWTKYEYVPEDPHWDIVHFQHVKSNS